MTDKTVWILNHFFFLLTHTSHINLNKLILRVTCHFMRVLIGLKS
jgi:hypothetical protein